MACDVCTNVSVVDLDSTDDANSILKCERCNVQVHQNCYGVENFSETWLCNFCASHADVIEKKCVLCPGTTGAFKPTTTNKWVHIVCGLFHPRVHIVDVKRMEPVDTRRIAKAAYGRECYICIKNGNFDTNGACVNCSHIGCKRNMHVTCGQTVGTLKEKMSKGKLTFIAFCEDHIDHKTKRLSFEAIEKVLKERKKVNMIEAARFKNTKWLMKKNETVSIFT
jgi:hypothetical protein